MVDIARLLAGPFKAPFGSNTKVPTLGGGQRGVDLVGRGADLSADAGGRVVDRGQLVLLVLAGVGGHGGGRQRGAGRRGIGGQIALDDGGIDRRRGGQVGLVLGARRQGGGIGRHRLQRRLGRQLIAIDGGVDVPAVAGRLDVILLHLVGVAEAVEDLRGRAGEGVAVGVARVERRDGRRGLGRVQVLLQRQGGGGDRRNVGLVDRQRHRGALLDLA